MPSTRVETTSHSTLVLCSCGARFVASTRRLALAEAALHETYAHPGVRLLRDRAARG